MEAQHDSNAAIWKSTEGVQEYVAKQAPREAKRQAQWRLMGELLPYQDDEPFTFVDIGAGTGSAARAVLDLFPQAEVILADFSTQMMDEAERVMEPYRGRYSYVEFDMTNPDWPSSIPGGLGAVVTSQCVHHIDDGAKQQLFRGIYDHLCPGGWYLNFDPVSSNDAMVESAWQRANYRQDPAAAESEHHRSPQERVRHENHVRYMVPLEPQLEFMRRAGFAALDVYWKHLDYVIYGGSKPRE